MPTPFAERLIQVRGKMPQLEFARRMDKNPNTLRSYERGEAQPNQEFLARLCTEFDVNPRWILLGEGLPYNSDYEPGYEFESEDTLREDIARLQREAAEKSALIEEYEEKLDIAEVAIRSLVKSRDAIVGEYLSFLVSQIQYVQDSFAVQVRTMKAEGKTPTEQEVKELVQTVKEYLERGAAYSNDVRNALEKLKKIKDDFDDV